MIVDDRGERAALRFRGVPILARTRGAGGPRRHWVIEIGWLSPEVCAIAGGVGLALIVSVMLGWVSPGWARVALKLGGTGLAVFGVLGFVSSVIASRMESGPHFESVVQRRRSQGRCRACAFPLASLPAEPDGCTVCPECGAAWRLPSPDG